MRNVKLIAIYLCLFGTVVLFQNCSQNNLAVSESTPQLNSENRGSLSNAISKLNHRNADGYVHGELLVAPVDSANELDLHRIYSQNGARVKRKVALGVHQIEVPEQALNGLEQALLKSGKAKYVERNIYGQMAQIPNDPQYYKQWQLPLMGAPSAWDITTGSSTLPIAVLDTGFDPNNKDIGGKFLTGYNASGNNNNYQANNSSCSNSSHGTVVASTAAGIGNDASGSAGFAWKNPIIPVLVFAPDCSLQIADAAEGIVWAADHGAAIINISWIVYWSAPPQTLIDAVNYALNKGIIIVAAAGNDNLSYKTDAYGKIIYSYPQTLSGVITVAATDSSDLRASFSNFGSYISVAAPGVSVYASGVGGVLNTATGTSFSAPLVSGVAALMKSINPGLSYLQIKDLLQRTALDLGATGFDPYYGYGRVNAASAVAQAAITPPEPLPNSNIDSTAPTAPKSLTGSAFVSTTTKGKIRTTYGVNLAWQAATDNVGVTAYEVYRNGTKLISVTALSYSDKSVTHGASYTYTVYALDAAGNRSTASNSVAVVP